MRSKKSGGKGPKVGYPEILTPESEKFVPLARLLARQAANDNIEPDADTSLPAGPSMGD